MSTTTRACCGLRTLLGVSFATLAILVAGLLTFALYHSLRASLQREVRARLRDTVAIAALAVDVDRHAKLQLPSDEDSPAYRAVRRELLRIRERFPDLHHIYTFRPTADGRIMFVVDAGGDSGAASHLGQVYDTASPYLRAHVTEIREPIVEPELRKRPSGTWLAGYAPLLRRDGSLEGVLGVEAPASKVYAVEDRLLGVALETFAAIVPLAVFLGWILGRRLAGPILSLKAATETVDGAGLGRTVAARGPREVRALAEAFNDMTDRLMAYRRRIESESEERQRAETALQSYRDDLEELVEARTQELTRANLSLHLEVNERRQAEQALRESDETVRLLLDSSGEGMYAIDLEGVCTLANPACARMLGYDDPAQLIGKPVHALTHHTRGDGSPYPEEECRMSRVMRDGRGAHVDDEVLWRADGGSFPVEYRSHPLFREGRITGAVITFSDITSRREAESRLTFAAEHDYLTGLPNRGLFMDRLDTGVARARRRNRPLALLYIDLDNFKPVNDRLGHQVGDMVLRALGRRLARTVREEDTVARIGGDEFAMILEDVSGMPDALAVAAKVKEEVSEPFNVEGQEIGIGVSIGVALYPEHGRDPRALLTYADAAMYRAKGQEASSRIKRR